jgi:hypothetical protein
MKNIFFVLAFLTVSLLSGCDLITGIFKAGAYTGIFIVVVVIALLVFVISKFGRRD